MTFVGVRSREVSRRQLDRSCYHYKVRGVRHVDRDTDFFLTVWLAVTIYRSSDALRRLAEADRQLFVTLYIRLTLTTLATFTGFGCVKNAPYIFIGVHPGSTDFL